jgi:hypothetical protein
LDLDVQCLVGMGIGGDADIGAGGSGGDVRWRRRWSLMHAIWISPHPERGEA